MWKMQKEELGHLWYCRAAVVYPDPDRGWWHTDSNWLKLHYFVHLGWPQTCEDGLGSRTSRCGLMPGEFVGGGAGILRYRKEGQHVDLGSSTIQERGLLTHDSATHTTHIQIQDILLPLAHKHT